MPTRPVEAWEHYCLRCGASWRSFIPEPKTCANQRCRSPYWNEDRAETTVVSTSTLSTPPKTTTLVSTTMLSPELSEEEILPSRPPDSLSLNQQRKWWTQKREQERRLGLRAPVDNDLPLDDEGEPENNIRIYEE